MKKNTDTGSGVLVACEEGVDPIEDRLRASTRTTIEAVFFEALDSFLGGLRSSRDGGSVKGARHGLGSRAKTGS